jgi:biopolymer transport protein ExbD
MNFKPGTQSQPPGFQLAPMIDVVFLLLCFFMTSQMFSQWETEIDVQLPTATAGTELDRLPGEIIINILKDGSIVVNRQVLDDEAITKRMKQILKYFPDSHVVIRADKTTDYEHVIHALDLCSKLAIQNISFATGREES